MKSIKRSISTASAALLLLTLGGSIFIGELLIMILLRVLSPLSPWVANLLDSSLLILIIFPILYFIVFRPLTVHITERKRAEEVQRESEARYRLLFEASADGILIADVEAKIFKYANPALCRMLGYTEEELRTLGLADIHPKQDLKRVIAEFEAQARGDKTLAPDIPCLRKDGTILYADINSTNVTIDGRPYNAGLFRDITERKRAEEALRVSESSLQGILHSTADGILVVSKEHKILFVNDRFAHMWKIPPVIIETRDDSIFLRSFLDQLIDPKGFHQRIEEMYESKEESFDTLHFKDGRIFESLSRPLMQDADMRGRVWSFRDVTERKRAQEEQEISESKFRAIFDNASDGMFLVDLKARKLFMCNAACAKMLGYAQEEFSNLDIADIHPREDLPFIYEQVGKFSRGEEGIRSDIRFKRKDGSILAADLSPALLTIAERKYLLINLKDITERKQAEWALKVSEAEFKEMFDDAPVGYHEIDAEGRIVRINVTELRLLGYVSEEMKGHFVWEFLDDQEASRQSVLAKLAGTKPPAKSVERIYRRKDLSTIAVVSEDKLLRGADGRITGIRTTLQDITERKKGEQLRLLLTTALESAANGVAITDLKGTIAWVNKAFTEMTGYSPAEAIGQNPSILKSGKVDDSFYKKLWETITAGNFWQGELINKKKDGSLYTDRMTITPLKNTNGEITNFIAIKADITEQKRTELVGHVLYDIAHAATTTENLDEFFGSIRSSLGELINTKNFYIALYDKQSESVSFPYFIDELYAPPHPRLLGNGLTDYIIRSGKPVLADVRTCEELEQQGHIGTIGMPSAIWLGAPLKLGDAVFGAIVVQSYNDPQCYRKTDIDILEFVSNQISLTIDRKQAQEKIRAQMSIIEESMNQLAKTRDQAMEASKTKSSFLANMSHELRTPLNAIIGYSEILLEEMGDVGEVAYTNDIQKIRVAGNNLLALINDILDISKIEAGRMDLFIEEFDLKVLLKEIKATIKPLVDKKSNTLAVQVPATSILLCLDHTKVRQILFNLLSNSCKFTNAGKITLSVSVDNSRTTFDHDVVIFSVKDSGIGMTPEEMKKLFLDFSQTDSSTTRKYGGTGLGLAITKKFCEMMNGSIDVHSIPNVGTTFTVTLPARLEGSSTMPAAPTNALKALSTTNRPAGPTVLVIDDDPNVRDLLARLLIKEGYTPVSAVNGNEGLALARKLLPMVVILDVVMPQKDGWAVLREMKDDPGLKSIPVIMHTIIDNRNLGFAIGAQDYLIKPVDHETLVRTIKRYVQPNRALNILIIDDEADQREILSRILLKQGWNVRTADGGRMALSLLAQSLPDVITLDLMMPTMDGFEFLKFVKENERWSHIPILILTSMDLNKTDYEKLTGSVATILRKREFDPQQLLDILRRYAKSTIGENVKHGDAQT